MKNNRRGIVLISVLMMLLTVAVVGGSAAELLATSDLTARNVADKAKALYLAEAGVAKGIRELRSLSGGELTTIGPFYLGDGYFIVSFNVSESVLISTGVVNDTERAIQFQYDTL